MVKLDIYLKNEQEFQKALKEASRKISDLTFPLKQIATDWFKSNRTIFMLRGPGGWTDLKEETKKAKKKNPGFIYPILERTGRLSASITQPANPEAIDVIINKKTLVVGSRVPYAKYHQYGTKFIPQRKFIFIGPEARTPDPAKEMQIGRLARWKGYLKAYTEAKLKEELGRG